LSERPDFGAIPGTGPKLFQSVTGLAGATFFLFKTVEMTEWSELWYFHLEPPARASSDGKPVHGRTDKCLFFMGAAARQKGPPQPRQYYSKVDQALFFFFSGKTEPCSNRPSFDPRRRQNGPRSCRLNHGAPEPVFRDTAGRSPRDSKETTMSGDRSAPGFPLSRLQRLKARRQRHATRHTPIIILGRRAANLAVIGGFGISTKIRFRLRFDFLFARPNGPKVRGVQGAAVRIFRRSKPRGRCAAVWHAGYDFPAARNRRL